MRYDAKILEKLKATPGDVVTNRQLSESLYGDREPAGSNVLQVLIARLRKAETGGTIVTHRGVGYSWVPAGE